MLGWGGGVEGEGFGRGWGGVNNGTICSKQRKLIILIEEEEKKNCSRTA